MAKKTVTCSKCSSNYDSSKYIDCPSCGHSDFLLCPECEFLYLEYESRGCPNCGHSLGEASEPVPKEVTPTVENEVSSPEPTIGDLIRAQNKTTFAVRSLALYFFISLQTSMLGGALIISTMSNRENFDYYGNLESGPSILVTLGFFIAFIGFLVAVLVGRFELNKSKI